MSLGARNLPRAEDLTLADVTMTSLEVSGTISGTAELDLTGVLACIDLNPAATGTQDVINITPSASLVAGSSFDAIEINLAALDPATGAACTLYGIHLKTATLTSVDHDANLYGFALDHPVADASVGFRSGLRELTQDKAQESFCSFGGTLELSYTGTYKGLNVDWDEITRTANSPVLQGVTVDLPVDYTSYGTSYAGYFSGDGRSVTLCDTSSALDVSGVATISGRTNAVGGLTMGTSKDAAGGVSLIDDLEACVLNWAEIASGTTLSAGQVTRAIWNRARVTAATTNQVSIYGSEAQIRIDGANLGDGDHAGLWAYFEQSGETDLASPGQNAAISATVEGSTDLDLKSGATLSGLVIDSSVHDGATIGGNFDAIWIKVSSAKERWGKDIRLQYGETIDNSVDGTVAISGLLSLPTGGITSGVDGTGYDTTLYSATANDYWKWDESADAVVHHITMGETTASETGHTITVVDATAASAGMHRGLVVDTTLSGTKTGSAYNAGINVDMSITGNTPQAYGVASYIDDTGAPTIGNVVGIESYFEDLGANVAMLVGCDIGINSTNTAAGRHTGMRIRNHSGTAKSAIIIESNFTNGIDFSGTNGTRATMTNDIKLQFGETISNSTNGTIALGGDVSSTVGYRYPAETTATPSGAFTVNWTTSHVQRVTITGTTLDVTFTDPAAPCKLVLVVVQGDGDDTIDWTNEASILWPGSVDPVLSTGSGEVDLITFYFDGTNYLGVSNYDFG